MAHDWDELSFLARELADAAAVETLRHFRVSGLEAENKLEHAFDPVTVADRAAEQAMRNILEQRRPQDAIVGEEYGSKPGTSGLSWVIDPIDGTRSYVSGVPVWGTLISVSDETGPKVGVVDQPYIGERFVGTPNGAFAIRHDDAKPIRTRRDIGLSEAMLFTTFPEVGSEQERAGFEAVSAHAKLTRYGLDCYAYALLALGQIDLVIEAGLNAYDIQGPMAVIEAAGGVVTDWKGNSAAQGGRILAAGSAELHAQALEIISRY